ncbi:exodeoxyribonuclease I [Candidatus Saccharibacteria bacterium]|nr:exodeoxyribonuclease I [Candidatus Saccharibacteria bacterium]
MDTRSFFFYDLETSGLDPRADRIMQFAGIRTDLDLNPIDEPVNLLVKLADDTLPSPGAIAVTKITPQMTQQDGLKEAELCRYLVDEIFTPGTCILGFNSIRFDDEFMRCLFWRNFYDPYEWQWKDGRSRWDMLDVIRLTRALRPEGINWPVQDGKKTNRLELITKLNHIEHEHAHDALADVYATVAVAKLIKEKQPDLFNYLFKMRDKKQVQKLINLENPKPFVYACGQYPSEFDKTSVAFPVAPSKNGNVYVWDLRYECNEVSYPKLKELKYNHCPAIAPLSVLDKDDGWQKIGLNQETVEKNFKSLLENRAKLDGYLGQDEKEFPKAIDPESALYDGFLDDRDRNLCGLVRTADKNRLADLHPEFTDERLDPLLLHYKAKNFPESLSEQEQSEWEKYRLDRLNRQAGPFMKGIEELKSRKDIDPFIIEELLLWSQSLAIADY